MTFLVWMAIVLLSANIAAVLWSIGKTDRNVAELKHELDLLRDMSFSHQNQTRRRLDRLERWGSDHVPAKFAFDPDESYHEF